jgi:hypothetical protein
MRMHNERVVMESAPHRRREPADRPGRQPRLSAAEHRHGRRFGADGTILFSADKNNAIQRARPMR